MRLSDYVCRNIIISIINKINHAILIAEKKSRKAKLKLVRTDLDCKIRVSSLQQKASRKKRKKPEIILLKKHFD